MRARTVFLALLPLLGCADLSPIAEDRCGNRVLDPGEDCDDLVDDGLGDRLACGSTPTTACRYVCGEASTCPLGWGCGDDGVCRQASGELTEGPIVAGWSPRSLRLVDLDGDGRLDLVGAFADRLEMRSRDASGTFVPLGSSLEVPVSGDVVVADLEGDPHGDILLPTSQGLHAWRGRKGGAPLLVAFAGVAVDGPSQLRMVPVRAPRLGLEGIFTSFFQGAEGVLLAVVTMVDGGRVHQPTVVGSSRSVDELENRVAATDLDGDGQDEIAFAFRGDEALQVGVVGHVPFSDGLVVRGIGADPFAPPTRVAIGEARLCRDCPGVRRGLTVEGGVRAADVDGDGRTDLLVDVAAEALPAGAVVVVPGSEGGLGLPYLDPRFELLATPHVAPGVPPAAPSAWPIAAGDLDRDGLADFVGADGVFMTVASGGDTPLSLAAPRPREWVEPWTDAALADVDGDSTLDVAAISRGEPFVDVSLCGLGDLGCGLAREMLRPRRYRMDLGVTQVRAGSLRGLTARDLVLIEEPPADEIDGEDVITVLLGQPGQWPEEPVPRARVRDVEYLEVASASFPGALGVDAFEDVQIVAHRPDGRPSFGLLYSDAAGQLTSPLTLTPGFASAKQALVGRFTKEQANRGDVIVIGEGPGVSFRAWYFPGEGAAGWFAREAGQALRDLIDPDVDAGCASFDVGDVDRDGLDEVVVLSGHAICGSGSPTRLSIGRVVHEAAEDRASLRFDTGIVDSPLPPSARIIVTDLDGDGAGDLVVAGTGGVQVLSGGRPTLLGDPQAWIETLPDERVLGVAPMGVPSRPGQLAVLTASWLLVLDAQQIVSRVPSSGARWVDSGDVDGDGLLDVALVGEDGVRVLLGRAMPPLGGAP